MELLYAPTSPFARKVRIAACELGLEDTLTLRRVDPWSDERLRHLNPLAKVPTLVLDDSSVLFESAVICEYLATQTEASLLFPRGQADRIDAQLVQALSDGAMTAMGRLFADEQSPRTPRSTLMAGRFHEARDSALDWLERRAMSETPTIGEISAASLLGYLDFRWPERNWRSTRPELTRWFDRFQTRASMQSTQHSL